MIDINNIDFEKLDGLIPSIILDDSNGKVLMLGFMNKEALEKTIKGKKVVFYSRTKKRLWLKGETSGNYLNVVSIAPDCDNDTLLINVIPEGPTCHTGAYSCFTGIEKSDISFLEYLFKLIQKRKTEMPENSYTTKLFKDGADRIIQKVGEESVETVIAAKNRDKNELINESSDLLYHMFVMLADQEIELSDIVYNLQKRHSVKK